MRRQPAFEPGLSLKNGRIVAMYIQPMSDGGWVATHEDITEQQQAEASIRVHGPSTTR